MKNKNLGILMAGAITAFTANMASATEQKATHGAEKSKSAPAEKAAPAAATPEGTATAMVKCYSASCSGKLEYKGQKNSCGGKRHSMEVPKEACDSKKGLMIEQ